MVNGTGDPSTMLAPEILRGRRLRPGAEPANRVDSARLRVVEDRRRHAADIGHVGLEHIGAEPGRDPGVDRVAAHFQYANGRHRSQIVTGRGHIVTSGDGRAKRCWWRESSHANLLYWR